MNDYNPYGILDRQQVEPMFHCYACLGEIYEGEPYYDLSAYGLGKICEACMDDFRRYAEY